MKKRQIIKSIVSTISCLTFICSFPSSQVNSLADDAAGDNEYYSTLDPNSTEYQEWKSQLVVNKETVPKAKLRSTITTDGIKNEYLELYYKNGIYSLGTIKGDPTLSTDNNKRLTYNLYGDEEANDIEEYLFSFAQVQNSGSIFAKSRSAVSNDYENNIIIRYNPHTDTVEEFKCN